LLTFIGATPIIVITHFTGQKLPLTLRVEHEGIPLQTLSRQSVDPLQSLSFPSPQTSETPGLIVMSLSNKSPAMLT
jgi:hypothetical protein